MKNILICFGCVFLLSACTFDIIGTPNDSAYLRNNKGEIVTDCNGNTISKTTDQHTLFWKYNDLPKGTTEFVCVGDKAYLPGKEPKP